MAANPLAELKRDELGVYLRDRGIPFTSRSKGDRLQLALEAERRSIGVLADDKVIVGQEYRDLLSLENGLITLPDPNKMSAGWEQNFSNFPNTTRVEVEEYINSYFKISNTNSVGSKAKKEGESMYLSGKVTGVEYHRVSPNVNYCFVRATVCRQMAETQEPYSVWVILHKVTGKVESAYCGCQAGLRGICKHVMSLLHLIVREVEAGSNLACTSRPQVWHKPHRKGKKLHEPDFVKNLTVMKVKGTFDSTPRKQPSKRMQFDPRAIVKQTDKSISDFDLVKLYDVTHGNCGLFLYAPRPGNENYLACAPDMDESNVHKEYEITTEVKSVLDIRNAIFGQNPNIPFEEFEPALLNAMKLDEESKTYICNSTVKQAESGLWFSFREGRITASRVSECIKKVDENWNVSSRNSSYIEHVMGYAKYAQTKEMNWGVKMESTSIRQYCAIQKQRHTGFITEQTGLNVSLNYPFLAGSPDALISCLCCGKGVIEVKNPFNSRYKTISEIIQSDSMTCLEETNGQIGLKRSHNYYAQVQCEMYVSGCKYADFVLRTCAKSDNIFIERIDIDDEFVTSMIKKCEIVYKRVMVPELFNQAVYHASNVKFIDRLLDSILDNVMSGVEQTTDCLAAAPLVQVHTKPPVNTCPSVPVQQSASIAGPSICEQQSAIEGPSIPVQQSVIEGPSVPLQQSAIEGASFPVQKSANEGPSIPLQQSAIEGASFPVQKSANVGPSIPLQQSAIEGASFPVQKSAINGPSVPLQQSASIGSKLDSAWCNVCEKECVDDPVSTKDQSIECDKCSLWFHYPCVGIMGNERFLKSVYARWFCRACCEVKGKHNMK